MVDVRGDVLRPPHCITPAAVKAKQNLNRFLRIFMLISKDQTQNINCTMVERGVDGSVEEKMGGKGLERVG